MNKPIILIIFLWALIHQIKADTYKINTIKNTLEQKELEMSYRALIHHEMASLGHREQENSPDMILNGSILSFGNSYILTLSKTRKDKITSFKLKASEIDELDLITKRLVRSVLKEQSPDTGIKIGEVTKSESKKMDRKKKVRKNLSFSLGPGWMNSAEETKEGTFINVGLNWGLDSYFDLGLALEIFEEDSVMEEMMWGILFNGRYHISDSKHSPYINLSFGRGSYTYESPDDDVDYPSGWIFGASIGHHFYRNHSTNMAIEAGYRYFSGDYLGKKPSAIYTGVTFYF